LPSGFSSDYRSGIAFHLGAISLFSMMGFLIRFVGPTIPTVEVMLFRSALALVPVAIVIWWCGGRRLLRPVRPWFQVLRATIGVSAMSFGFYTLARMPYADFITLSFTAPLFATVLSIPLLGERVGWRRLSAVVVGFCGVVVAVQPTLVVDPTLLATALTGALLHALAILSLRVLGASEAAVTTAFYFTLGCLVPTAAITPWHWVPPTPGALICLCAAGLLGGCAQMLISAAYRRAPPAILTPFDYTALLWAVGLEFVVFGNLPHAATLTGALMIAGAGVYIHLRESRGATRDRCAPASPRPP